MPTSGPPCKTDRLAPVRSAPAEPDLDLTFKVVNFEVLPDVQAKSWTGITPLWLDRTSPPSVFVFDSKLVRIGNGPLPQFAFPSGAESIPPSIDGILGLDWDNDQYPDVLLPVPRTAISPGIDIVKVAHLWWPRLVLAHASEPSQTGRGFSRM